MKILNIVEWKIINIIGKTVAEYYIIKDNVINKNDYNKMNNFIKIFYKIINNKIQLLKILLFQEMIIFLYEFISFFLDLKITIPHKTIITPKNIQDKE